MITVAVLGPLEVRRDGVLLPVPAGRTAEVLVRLALEAGRPVRAERIIDDLWGDAGRNTLQSKVSQLRRALGDPTLVVARDGGYLLDLPPDRVDALRVAALAGEDPRGALALFRGELPRGDWFHPHRVRLEAIRLGLVEDLAAARADVAELEALVEAHPLRERLWFSLITALHAAGRQADALAAYARVRQLMIDELGVEPGAQLRTLHGRILRASAPGNLPALSAKLIGRAAELAALDGRLRDHRLVTLVGTAGVGKTRVAIEAARAMRARGGVWLVRLDAADATTSIPRAIAETMRVAANELLERLAGADTVLVLDNCEHIVGPVAAATDRLLTAAPSLRVLATSQLPLGLDGEHVFPLAPLPPAESVALFTARARESRRHFTLDPATAATVEEVCRALDGLPLAIELAAARVKTLPVREIARRLDDRFVLLRDPSGHRPALATAISWSYDLLLPDDRRGLWALSAFADGAPLPAAEHVLTALGIPPHTVVDVTARLVDRSLATAEFTDEGTVRYRLLDSIRAFAATRAAETPFTPNPPAEPPAAEGAIADALFTFADAAAAAHAAWFAAEAARHAATIRGPAQADRLAFARAERANVDAALAWCAANDPPLGTRMANGFGWTWVVLGDGVAGAARVRAALPNAAAHSTGIGDSAGSTLSGAVAGSTGSGDPAGEAVSGAVAGSTASGDPVGVTGSNAMAGSLLSGDPAGETRTADPAEGTPMDGAARDRTLGLLLAGWLEASAGDVGRAAADLDEALALADRLADERLRADAGRHLAFLRIQQGRPQEAVALAASSLRTCRTLGLAWETAASLLLASYGAIMLGDTAGAAAQAGEASRLLAPLGDAWGQVHAEGMLGAIAHAEGRFTDAARSLAQAAEAAEKLGFLGQAALHLTTLGRVQQRAGDAAAAATLGQAIATADISGDLRITATARVHLARVRRAAGDLPGARELLIQADTWYRQAGGDGALLTRCLLASPAFGASTSEAAALAEILGEARATGHGEVEVLALDGLARLATERTPAASERTPAAVERTPAAVERTPAAVERTPAAVERNSASAERKPEASERADQDEARRLLAAADEHAASQRHLLDEADRPDAAVARGRL